MGLRASCRPLAQVSAQLGGSHPALGAFNLEKSIGHVPRGL